MRRRKSWWFVVWGVVVKLSLNRERERGDLSDYNTRLLLFEHSVKVDMILKQVNRELGEYIVCFFFHFEWWWWFWCGLTLTRTIYNRGGSGKRGKTWTDPFVCADTWLYNYTIVVNLGQRFCFFFRSQVKVFFLLGTEILGQKLNANRCDEMRSLMGNGDFFFGDKQLSHLIPTMRHFVLFFFELGNRETNILFGWDRVCVCRCMCWISTNL